MTSAQPTGSTDPRPGPTGPTDPRPPHHRGAFGQRGALRASEHRRCTAL